MNNGIKISWRLIFITMCIMLLFSLLGAMPCFSQNTYLFTAIGELLIFIPIFIGMKLIAKKQNPHAALKKGFSPSLIPILIFLPFCTQTFVTYITFPINVILYEIIGYPPEQIAAAESVSEFVVQIIVACLIPAIAEEFFCRGVIIDILKPYGIVVSAFMSALAFTMLHFSIHSFIVIFVLGLLLAAVRILTGSIWPSVIMHFFNNFMAVVITMLDEEKVILPISLISLILYPMLIILLLKYTRKNVKEIENVRKKPEFSYEMLVSIGIFAIVTLFTNL